MKGTYDPVFFLDHYNWGNVISWICWKSIYYTFIAHVCFALQQKEITIWLVFKGALMNICTDDVGQMPNNIF